MATIVLFLLGLVVGSFLNVVGLRWGTGETLSGRSRCPSCKKTLRWFELVPLVSFLALRRKCGTCGAHISWQYPLVELWTGLIFATVPDVLIPIFCIFIVITIYDFKHKIIPDPLVYTCIILALLSRFLYGGSPWDYIAGPMIFIFFWSFWFFSKGRLMGFGDAKLGLAVGLLLGAKEGYSAIVLAFWIGAAVSLLYLALLKSGFLKNDKGLTIKSEVPFAPFIIIGAWLTLIFHLDIINALLF